MAAKTKQLTPEQQGVMRRLLRKGWIDPWHYRQSVYLFLPLPAHVRRARRLGPWRDHTRPPIKITPTGRILAGY